MICSLLILFIFAVLIIPSNLTGEGGYKQEKLLSLRGIFAVLIITDHLSQEMNNPGAMWLFSWLGYIIVSLFFAMSGYGLMKKTISTQGTYLKGFLLHRLPSVLIPFWLANALYLIGNICFYGIDFTWSELGQYAIGIRLINTNAWYVLSLLVLYFLFWIAIRKQNKIDRLSGCILLIGLLTYFVVGVVIIKKYWWVNSIFGFMVGILVANYENEWVRWKNRRIMQKMFFVGTGAGLSLIAGWMIGNIFIQLPCMIVASVSASILFFVVVDRIMIKSLLAQKLGAISYELYLYHNFFRHLYKDIYLIQNDIFYYVSVLLSTIIVAALMNVLGRRLIKLVQ